MAGSVWEDSQGLQPSREEILAARKAWFEGARLGGKHCLYSGWVANCGVKYAYWGHGWTAAKDWLWHDQPTGTSFAYQVFNKEGSNLWWCERCCREEGLIW